MAGKCILVLAAALMLVGCVETEQKIIVMPKEGSVVIEAEKFALTNAQIQKLDGAGEGKVIVLLDETSKAEATVQMKKGNYVVTVYVLGPSEDEDAFYIAVGKQAPARSYPTEPGVLQPIRNDVYYTHPETGPCKIELTFGEPNVQLDRVEIKHSKW